MKIGLCGAHRVGKTTLGLRLAEELKIEFVHGSATSGFGKFGKKPADVMPFSKRLEIQFELLSDYLERFSGRDYFVTDRTPIDYIGYTLAELNNAAALEQLSMGELKLHRYVTECYEALNATLDVSILVQPGIAIVNDNSKGVCSSMMIEKLNLLMCSSTCDERSTVPTFILDRGLLDLDGRIDVSLGALRDLFGDSLGTNLLH
ncbi:hypothetical protein [Shewanella glacialipiscicola]|uniref:hypothetical protein n=1 Tax=Shewanella glacialipiscicola TaxID=614069 RepID=UPI003D793405